MKKSKNSQNHKREFSREVLGKAERKLKAGKGKRPVIWFGLGMMGFIGWSVAIPTLLGVALGFWLDKHFPGKNSYTLALMVAGLLMGCYVAWHWVAKEEKEMKKDQEDNDK